MANHMRGHLVINHYAGGERGTDAPLRCRCGLPDNGVTVGETPMKRGPWACCKNKY